MALISPPPLSLNAVLLNGMPTVVFPSKPWTRILVLVDMQNPVTASVTAYIGIPGAAQSRRFSNLQGSNQQWTKPIKVPAGQNFFVQWNTGPSNVTLVRATITWMEDDGKP